jgi:phospholipase D1/2
MYRNWKSPDRSHRRMTEPLHPASNTATGPGLLQAGRNCWRIERAQRFALLVDADSYFSAVRAAMREAKHSIFILSWDIDSRTCLAPGGAGDGYPEPLGDFLHAVVSARPELHAYVLNWDFAMLYALEREWLPLYKMDWRTHRRLSFRMDGKHPIGASHHQKVVVIDDAVAFVGGLDLTRCRWDTPQHACSEPLRRDTTGKSYAPFHDVQSIVDGDVALALGELCRARWQRATGHAPAAAVISEAPWPEQVKPDLTDIDVAIARTEPAFDGSAGVHEIRQLHLDAIAAAGRHLFFENQYFTSGLIAGALSARLEQDNGPEVMVISPQTQSGWLEHATMGVLRARVHKRLKEADRHGRYGLYCPHVAGLGDDCLNVHSKVFAVDDNLFSVGSANLSSRSMAFDTECNLVLEARGSPSEQLRVRNAIAGLRNRLLAEHSGCSPQQVDAEIRRSNSLHAVAEKLGSEQRRLQRLEPEVAPELDALIPEQAPFDPERPIDPDQLVEQLVPEELRQPAPRRFIGLGALALALALLAVAWRWTPLREWVNLASLIAFARGLDDLPFTPVAVVAAYAVAGLVVPITVLIAATGIVFGPVTGALYAIVGSTLSAGTTYCLGEWLGRDTVRRLVGPRINRLSKRIAERGVLAMLVIRILPIAPFTVVNVVAGASHIRLRDFLLGTLLGMAPGILLTVTFVHNLAEAIRNPSPGTLTVLGFVVAALLGAAVVLQRWLPRKQHPAPQ